MVSHGPCSPPPCPILPDHTPLVSVSANTFFALARPPGPPPALRTSFMDRPFGDSMHGDLGTHDRLSGYYLICKDGFLLF